MEDDAAVESQRPPQGEPRSASRKRKKKSGARGAPRNAQYWMLVSSPENFRRTKEHGFTLQGVKTRHRKRVESMRPGDRLLYYITGRMSFAGAVTLTSPMFEDHQPIWRTARREEDYPWRIRIRPDSVLEEPDWVTAKDLAYRLEYVRKWPPEHWTLAFQGHLHQLPQKDFKLIEDEFRRARAARRKLAAAPAS